mmetsp:Transcript_40189/g.113804  ORF Transcript_40189/g.113804 Transcript_40189/m.113804 type:complete len:346 (-) Transcript_40189:293-1330(-)
MGVGAAKVAAPSPLLFLPLSRGPFLHELHSYRVLRSLPAARAPQQWQRYDLLDVLGSGATGEVYLALSYEEGSVMGSPVCLKTYHSWLDEAAVAEDMDGHECLRSLPARHESLLQVYEINRAEKYVVMEWVDGVTLMVWAKRELRLGTPIQLRAANMFRGPARDVLMALLYFTHAGCAHRDIKGDNILLDERAERTKICDPGWVSCSQSTDLPVRCTEVYCPPELCGLEQCALHPGHDWQAYGLTMAWALLGYCPILWARVQECVQDVRAIGGAARAAQARNELILFILEKEQQFPPALVSFFEGFLQSDTGARVEHAEAYSEPLTWEELEGAITAWDSRHTPAA